MASAEVAEFTRELRVAAIRRVLQKRSIVVSRREAEIALRATGHLETAANGLFLLRTILHWSKIAALVVIGALVIGTLMWSIFYRA